MQAGPKIILLDDDEKMLSMYRRLFETFPNATIFATTSPIDALNTALYSPPDLFLMDIMHPGIDGITLAKRLRKSSSTKNIHIWLISGNASSIPMDVLTSSGADLVCEKPCSFAFLFENAKKIFNSIPVSIDTFSLDFGVESPDLDYKRTLDLSSKDCRAAFSKDVIAFANYGGGKIILGINERQKGHFEQTGVDASEIGNFEVTNLNKAIIDYIDPGHHVSSKIVSKDKKYFVIITIPPIESGLLLARKENPKAGLFLGRIYTRTCCAETKEVTRAEEIRALIDRIVAHKSQNLTVKKKFMFGKGG